MDQQEEHLRRDDGGGVAVRRVPQSRQLAPSINGIPEAEPGRSASKRVRLRLVRDTEADYFASLALAKALHARTLFHELPFSETKARALFRRAIDRPERCCLILAEMPWHGQGDSEAEAPESVGLAGFAYVQAGEHFLAGGDLIATVLAIGVAPRIAATQLGGRVALRLVAAVRKWSSARGCKHLLVHATSGIAPARVDRFFRRCGFKVTGGNYVG